MSRFGRVPRRPDHWSSAHERAKARAAERLDAPLDPAEAAWLEDHLAGCDACRGIATAYETDRLALRAMRDAAPEPPRDLWARTAAAIEGEARHGAASHVRGSRFPLGAVSGVAVVAIVLGASALSGGWLDQPAMPPAATPGVAVAPSTAAPSAVAPTLEPDATPMTVAAGSVGWIRTLANGTYAYSRAKVDAVCPVEDEHVCAALEDDDALQVALASAPRSVIGSPDDSQAVVVGSDGAGGDQVLVVALPEGPEPTVEPSDTPEPTAEPTETAATTPTAEPSGPVDPSATVEPTESATTEPSTEPTETPEPIETPAPTPTLTPEPTVAAALAIARGVTVVGESSAFTPDGAWFAFTAQPSDGSGGPDIYVWHAGDPEARRLTKDGRSVFGSWEDERVIGSTLVPDDLADDVFEPSTFSIDPSTSKRTELSSGLWRPAVDPTGTFALVWDGSVRAPQDGSGPVSVDEGALRLVRWPADGQAGQELPGLRRTIGDYDARWDETGTWLAVWVDDPTDPDLGRLTLYRLDRDAGRLERPKGAPDGVPALPGFSISDGRLAWATPSGQDAEGSRVQVVAWSGDGVGKLESTPGEGVLVIR